jgi:hypothetical protein
MDSGIGQCLRIVFRFECRGLLRRLCRRTANPILLEMIVGRRRVLRGIRYRRRRFSFGGVSRNTGDMRRRGRNAARQRRDR